MNSTNGSLRDFKCIGALLLTDTHPWRTSASHPQTQPTSRVSKYFFR